MKRSIGNIAVAVLTVMCLTGCVRQEPYTQRELENEKYFVELYLQEKYPDHEFDVVVDDYYVEASDGDIPHTAGYRLDIHAYDENGDRLDIFRIGVSDEYRDNYKP
jgi:hypothetical protein